MSTFLNLDLAYSDQCCERRLLPTILVLRTSDEESLGTKRHRNEAAADRECGTASVGE